MKKQTWVALAVSIGLLLGGCSSNDFDVKHSDQNNTSDNNGTSDSNGTSNNNNTAMTYQFMNAKSIIVSRGAQDSNITVQLVDKDGVGVEGKSIRVKALPQKYGSLSPATATTDAAGVATFSYKAPSEITPLNKKTEKVTLLYREGDNKITTDAWIAFNSQVVNPGNNSVKPVVVIPKDKQTITLHNNSQSEVIAIKVFKDGAPYSGGSVKVELPAKVLAGKDVGLFDTYEVVPDTRGVAEFHYTGPGNLRDLIAHDDNSSLFKFYHTENTQAKSEMLVKYAEPSATNVTRNYNLDVMTDGNFSMGIPNKQKTFSVSLKAKDGNGNDTDLTNESITQMRVETTNGTVSQIVGDNNLVDKKELTVADYKGSFTLQSKKLSGLVPMKIIVEFTDTNGKTHLQSGGDYPALVKIVNVRVFSGPPTAISISYVGTGQDKKRAKYIESFAISVTDEYGNKVNTHPNIAIGAIAGYTVDGKEAQNVETNTTHRLFYGRDDIQNHIANGQIENIGGNKAQFHDETSDRNNVFKYVNSEGNNTDKLVVFGERKNYEAMGKWDIASVDDNRLGLEDDYFGKDRSGLYYAVGHNYYQDQCLQDGREWIGSTDADSYEIDDEGTVVVRYSYDYHLAGKDILLWVNLDGEQPDTGKKTRVGEVLKHTLRSAGLIQAPAGGFSLDKNTTRVGTFTIWHKNAPERYRNAHFGYVPKGGSTCGATVIDSSNSFDARTCNNHGSNDGTSYVTFFLWSAPDKGCTFNIDGLMVAREFPLN